MSRYTSASYYIFFIYLIFFIPTICGKEGPIDAVYTWVDNDDLLWQFARKRTYKKFKYATVDANNKMRFRNRDELRYSLRSIHKFARFINHIYIVTCGQVPKWFKPHPKVSIVYHEKIFPNKNNLPTFNSHAIESNLHHIPELSERYIYMNDDFFFARSTSALQFFDTSGRMKIFVGHYDTPRGLIKKNENGWKAAWKNTNTLLDLHFGPQERRGFYTAPSAFNKSTVYKIEKTFSLAFKQVSANPFRSNRCYTMTNGLIPYVALYWKQAIPGALDHKTVFFGSSVKENRAAFAAVKKTKLTSFGIEDMTTRSTLELNLLLHDFLESYFPEKAPWEKD